MQMELEEVNVAGAFEDLSDVQIAYLQQEFSGLEAINAVMAAVKPDVAAVERKGFWAPLPLDSDPSPPLKKAAVAHVLKYADAEDEVFYRIHNTNEQHIGDVECFLRACVQFFGRTWQPIENLVFVACAYLQLADAAQLTTRRFMLKTGAEAVQGTWFPYWEQGETHADGVKQVKYRLARPFFGDFSHLRKDPKL
jgi:hypothetical protein